MEQGGGKQGLGGCGAGTCGSAPGSSDGPFPRLWGAMFPREFKHLTLPQEREATCDRCPKARFENYRADYRCCTYWPRIPNYLLGLAVGSPQGKDAIVEVIERGMALPEGMVASPSQWRDYTEDLAQERFGSSDKVLCPMLDKKTFLCRIHAWRNSVCSTYFCFKDHGKVGDRFWSAVSDLGSQVEAALGQWALRRMGFSLDAYLESMNGLGAQIDNLSDPRTGGWTEASRKLLWGDWFGRELEFYQQCGQWIERHQDVLWEIAGDEDIRECRTFENALERWLPQGDDKGQSVDDDSDDSVDEGEPWSVQELWQIVQKTHDKMWKLPLQPVQWHVRVTVGPNPMTSERDRDHAGKPYRLIKASRRKKDSDEAFLYLTEPEYQLLLALQKPTLIDWRLLSSPMARGISDCRGFLAECLGQEILMVVR